MQVTPTDITDVKIIEPTVYEDERGLFLETFSQQRYQQQLGITHDFVQDNFSRSKKQVLRGLHFQIDRPQGKLVQVLAGEVYDVAVDVRRHSATFGQWVGVYLSADNNKQLWIPPGFAHGFVVLSDFAHFYYKCTDYYDPQSEQCLLWNDPAISIAWPIDTPILSAKDQQGRLLRDIFS